MFPSCKSHNLNPFQYQSENLVSKSSYSSHSKSRSDTENQENQNPNQTNKGFFQSNSKERSSAEILKKFPTEASSKNDKSMKTRQEEEEEEEDKMSILTKESSFITIDEILDSLKEKDEDVSEILYIEGDYQEGTNAQKGKLLRDSFISQFEKGITEYGGEGSGRSQEKSEKIFPRLNPKNYELVEILGRGYHGVACKLRDKDHNEIVVKLYFKEQKEAFFNEACALSECRQYFERECERGLLYVNKYKDGIPPCFEMEKYYGLTLQAGFATLRGLKNYLKETNKRLSEAQFCELARRINDEYLRLWFLKYVHRDIKPENIILLPSFSAKIIDFGFAIKYDKFTEMIKGRVGTKQYMSPDLIRKESKDSITTQEVFAGDLYALGLSLLEIIEPTLNLKEMNRTKAIERALKKVKNRSQGIYSAILKFLDYQAPNLQKVLYNEEIWRWGIDSNKDNLKEVLEEFKRYLEEKNLGRKSVLEMKKNHLKEDDEDLKTLFEKSQGHFEEKKGHYQELDEEDQIGLWSYFQVRGSSNFRWEAACALVKKRSEEGCRSCKEQVWELLHVKKEERLLNWYYQEEIE